MGQRSRRRQRHSLVNWGANGKFFREEPNGMFQGGNPTACARDTRSGLGASDMSSFLKASASGHVAASFPTGNLSAIKAHKCVLTMLYA